MSINERKEIIFTMSEPSQFEIPQTYKIIKVSVSRDQLATAYNDPQIHQNNEIALNYLTKDFQGTAQFFDIDFNDSEAIVSWGVKRGSPEAENHNKQGLEEARKKEFDKAIEHWRRAVYINRTDPDTLYNLTLAYFEITNYTKALDKCLEVLSNCPVYFRAHFLLGSIYSKLRKFEQAAEHLEKGLLFQPENVMVLVNLGAIYSILRRSNDAIHCFEKAISVSPSEKKAYLGLGKIYAAQNDFDNANRNFKAVIKLDPNGKLGQIAKNSILSEPPAPDETTHTADDTIEEHQDADELYSKAYQYFINSDYEKASQLFGIYLKEKSRDYRAWSILSICQLRSGQKQPAISSIEKALLFQSKNPALYKQASILYEACGMATESANAAAKAYDMGKHDSVTLTLLGIGKAHNGQLQDSARVLYDAVSKNPNNLKARYSLANVLFNLGQNDSAKQQLEEILWTENQTPLKDKARDLLTKIA